MRVPVASGHSLPQRRSFPVNKHYTCDSNRKDGQSTSSCFYLNKVELPIEDIDSRMSKFQLYNCRKEKYFYSLYIFNNFLLLLHKKPENVQNKNAFQ